MQVVYKDEDEGGTTRGTGPMGASYMQGGSADVWKENMLEELEVGELEFETVEEFLAEIKKKFGEGEEESVKAAELRKIEQEGRTMKEFVQEFKKVVR